MAVAVSVVLVNYRSCQDVVAALARLRHAEPDLDYELIVVDNSGECVDEPALSRSNDVVLISNQRNVGFGAACNQASEVASGRCLLFLNPDVRVGEGSVSKLLAEAESHPDAMVLAPCLENRDGSLQYSARRFYDFNTVLFRRTLLGRLFPDHPVIRAHLMKDSDHDCTRAVDWVIGAAFLVRREDFLRVGRFDERYFLYFEDLDYCLRAWRSQRTVLVVGSARMQHAHRRQSVGMRSLRAKWAHLAALLQFLGKYGGWAGRPSSNVRRPLVFVNLGAGVLGERARCVAKAIGGQLIAKDGQAGGRVGRGIRSAWSVFRARPRLLYVLDVGVVGVVCQFLARSVGSRVILDTGDEHYELYRRTDEARGGALAAAGVIERLALGFADGIAARGNGHVAALRGRGYNYVTWLPDGVDAARFHHITPDPWRDARGWQGNLVIGCLGSLIIDRRYGVTQGWELIEALALLPDVRGAVIGDGMGRRLLEERAEQLGVSDRLVFFGRREPDELPALIASFDMCLSTQTDDPVGHSRTTGKLPLFMASGRFILATAVGEATRLLPDQMLLPFHGEFDRGYPARLAARIREIDLDRSELQLGESLVDIAREQFDYGVIGRRAASLAGERIGVSA